MAVTVNKTRVDIVQGDITTMAAEAIVNAANSRLTMTEGLAGVIKAKGGGLIEEEAAGKAPVAVGAAVATSAGKLKAKHVIHAVTRGEDLKTGEDDIRRATASALQTAADLKVRSLALPALGCGTGGFSPIGVAKIMAQEVLKAARFGKSNLEEITFCLFDEPTYQTFHTTISGYLTHILDDLGSGPYVTVDAIIELPEGIILIERSNPPYGWALPGGFVDVGESLETAALREAKEETNMDLEDLRQFHTYSDPDRDPRFHTVSTVFIGRGRGSPQFGDDARGLKVVPYADLLDLTYAFDHKRVIADYLKAAGRPVC